MLNYSYKNCIYCGKKILANAEVCKHCGTRIKSLKKEDNEKTTYTRENIFPLISFWLVIGVLFYSFCADTFFRLTHLNPKVSSMVSEQIDVTKETIQKNSSQPEQLAIKVGSKNRILILQAEYSQTGIIIAKNTNFWTHGIMRNDFDETALFDLGIVWGEIADKKLLEKHFKFTSQKTLGQARTLRYQWQNLKKYDKFYITTHIAHNHIIPANDNIISALFKIKKWDKVKLDGYLVDVIYPNGNSVKTSLSRSDINPTSRGNGSCEIFYLTGIQIGNKYYK